MTHELDKAAGLVERKLQMPAENLLGGLDKAITQRDEARREAEELGKQIAAMRVALDHIADHPPWGGEDISNYIKWMQKVAIDALTDTAEAAAPAAKPQAGEGTEDGG